MGFIMKMFSLILLLVALLLIQVACEKTPEQPINSSTQEKSDVTETGGNGTLLYEVPNTGIPTPCEDYVTDLVVNNNISDWNGANNEKIGTLTVQSDGDFLYFHFKLTDEKIDAGCYITKVTGNAWVLDAYDDRYVPPGVRTISEPIANTTTQTYTLKMPWEEKKQIGPKLKDYSFYCKDILGLMGSIEVCCPGGNLGNGNGNSYIIDGLQTLYASNSDINIGTVVVKIENGNIIVQYNVNPNTAPNMPIKTTHFDIFPIASCPYDNIPVPGRTPPGQMNFGSEKASPFGPGTFSNQVNGKYYTWTWEMPLEDFKDYYDITNLCDMSFCISTHADVTAETAYAGGSKNNGNTTVKKEDQINGNDAWYRYFTFTVKCGTLGEGEPTCETAWSFGNRRYCLQLPNVDGRYWYWVTTGYTFCCEPLPD
jgi:hypothetical protein